MVVSGQVVGSSGGCDGRSLMAAAGGGNDGRLL